MNSKNLLWAPWRIEYIKRAKEKGCIFCKAYKTRPSANNFIIRKTSLIVSLLNIYPYNNGHIMVAPKRHVNTIEKLTPEEIKEIFSETQALVSALKKIMNPSGFNIGMNIGSPAGAGITGHLHLHIVPRWEGDTNFMPILSKTKVISQSLKEVYKEIKNELKKN